MTKWLITGLAVLSITIPLLYVGAYLALVKCERPFNVTLSGPGPFLRKVSYRVDGPMVECIFSPIHEVDKRIRYDYWRYDYDLDGIDLRRADH